MSKKYKTILPLYLQERAEKSVNDFIAKVEKFRSDHSFLEEYNIEIEDTRYRPWLFEALKTKSAKNITDSMFQFAGTVFYHVGKLKHVQKVAVYYPPGDSKKYLYCRDNLGRVLIGGLDEAWRFRWNYNDQEWFYFYSLFGRYENEKQVFFYGNNVNELNEKLASSPKMGCYSETIEDIFKLYDKPKEELPEGVEKPLDYYNPYMLILSDGEKDTLKMIGVEIDDENPWENPMFGEVMFSDPPLRWVLEFQVDKLSILNMQYECDKLKEEARQINKQYKIWKEKNRGLLKLS